VSLFAALVLAAGFVALIVEYLVSRKRLPLLRLVTWRTHVFVIRAFLLPLPYRIRDVAAFELRGPSSRPVETMVEQYELSTLEMVIGHRIVRIHTRNEFQRVDVERFSTQVREAKESKTGA
jgi:hypothetical protein